MDSGFDKIRRNNCTLFINKNFRNDNLEQALSGGEKTLQERYELTPVPSSDNSRIHKFTVSFAGVDREVYFKQYLCRSVCDFIKHLVRPSRARRTFKASLILEENGFEAPAVVAMGEYKTSFLDRENFLVTLEAENTKQIWQFIPDNLEKLTKKQLQDKRELIRVYGQTVGKMHSAGIFHGDLHLGNVLARKEGEKWRFFFLDNERTQKFYRLPARLRLKNLVRLNICEDGISRTDRLRFFKVYLHENPLIARKQAKWLKKVNSKTKRRLKKRELSLMNAGLTNLSKKQTGYYEGKRKDMLKYVPQGIKTSLEFGCGFGEFSALLKERFGTKSWAVEIEKAAAQEAAKKLDRVINADANESLNDIPENYFDCIILFDILEHLVDPYSLLCALKTKLTHTGVIIASIPNIRYYRVFVDLVLHGNWDYKDHGVLDKSHLRFFTYKSIAKMFNQLDFELLEFEGIHPTSSRTFRLLNTILLNALSDVRYKHFVAVVRPK